MPGPSLVRCAIYTRQSVARTGRDPSLASCALQREACLALVAANVPLGWIPITEQFDDEGESGADTRRPALERLLEAVVEGRFDRVLVHRLDRLTRRAADWARIDDVFRANDVAISVVDGGLAVSPPPREMPKLRYYRCRGSGCTRAQLPAKAIESLVPRLFADPASDAPDYVRNVFLDVSRMWDVLIVPNRRRILMSLCSEIRWDAERSALRIIADEEGIANGREGWHQIQVAREAGWPARP